MVVEVQYCCLGIVVGCVLGKVEGCVLGGGPADCCVQPFQGKTVLELVYHIHPCSLEIRPSLQVPWTGEGLAGAESRH